MQIPQEDTIILKYGGSPTMHNITEQLHDDLFTKKKLILTYSLYLKIYHWKVHIV
jgi:hypothetical protein